MVPNFLKGALQPSEEQAHDLIRKERGGRTRANSFSKELRVFLGAGVGRAEAGPCLAAGACGYLALTYLHKTLLGEPQACNPQPAPRPTHPPDRSCPSFPLLSNPVSQVWTPWDPFARPKDIRAWKGPAPNMGAFPCNQPTTFTESKSAMTALGNEPGEVIQER